MEYHNDYTNPDPASPPSGTLRSYIANIIFVGITQSCPDPTNQSESNYTQTSADLSWTENGTATSWDIELGASVFTPTGTPTQTGVTNPYTYTGLTDNTTYDWYVRADCGSGSYSNWVGASSFTTACTSTTVPYFQSFDDVTAPDFPNCMTVENTNGDSKEWETNTTNHSSPNSARISYNSSEAMDDWFFTRGLDLTGGTTYEVSFVYKAASATYPEKLAVDFGSSAYSTAMSGTPMFDNNNITNTSWEVGNGTFTPSSTGTYYVGFHGYSDADQFSLYVDDIQVTEYNASASWDGSSDNDWRTAANWSTNAVPGASTNVTIPSGLTNYPTLTSYNYCNDLTIQSDASGDGSLIGVDYLMIGGTATVQRYLTGGQWHDVAAMTDGATVNSFYFNHSPDVWMKDYDESTDSYSEVTDLTTTMPLGTGFVAWVESGYNATAEFTGTINGSDVTPTLSYTDASHGFNFLGNPFSSPIQWGSGSWNLTNVDSDVWVWDGTAGSYKTYAPGSGGSLTDGIIPLGQGFFVHANAASPSLTIPADAQTHSTIGFYKPETVLPHFVIASYKGVRSDEVWIVFREGSTEAYENGFDGRKMIAEREGAAPQVYTREGEEFFSIDCLPPVDENGRTIPLYFKANENGEQSLEARDLDLVPGIEVILEDTKLNIMQNLNKKPVYTFNAVTYQNPARFLLHLNRTAYGIDENSAENIHAYAYDKNLYISSTGDAVNVKKQLKVYDMLGRTVIEQQIAPGDLIKIPLNLSNSYVIVKIIGDGKVYTNKVFIK